MNAQFDDQPEAYDALRSCWLNTRRRMFVEEFVKPLPAGASVLEVGAGAGRLLIDLAAMRPDVTFVGLEPLENYVEYAGARAAELALPNVRFVAGVAETIDAASIGGPVDLVLTNDVLHHVKNLGATCRSIRAVSRANARWLAIEPSWINPYVFMYHVRTEGERLFMPRRFRAVATESGWRWRGTRRLFLIPSKIADPKPWMRAVERVGERCPVLAGGIAFNLAAD